MKTCMTAIAATAMVFSLAAEAAPISEAQEDANKELVRKMYTTLFVDHKVDEAMNYLSPNYIQHNPFAGDGREFIRTAFKDRYGKFPKATTSIKCILADGDLVALQAHDQLDPDDKSDPGRAVVDIFRIENGLVAEHWDVVRKVSADPKNKNGEFVSSPALCANKGVAHEEANKKVVASMHQALFMDHRVDEAIDKYISEAYVQHAPGAPNGTAVIRKGFTERFQKYPQAVSVVKHILADGDLVLTHHHRQLTPGVKGTAIADIFRVENGKIVEHWDVVQDVPETANNDNGMF